MLAHPTLIRDYMDARFLDGLRRAEAAVVGGQPRKRTRPWSRRRLPGT
jgi:hypothetical protein